MYDGPNCGAGENEITDSRFFISSLTTEFSEHGSGLLSQELTFSTSIVPENITESNAYEPLDKDAQIQFCVRVGLYNEPLTEPDTREVNYLETTITLIVDLTDNFAISAQTVEARDRGVETSEDAFYVEGFMCYADGQAYLDERPFLQGQMIRVCVQPTQQALEFGLRMRTIDRFTFVQGFVTQEAVINQGPAINGLTDLWCDRGSTQCQFETLLMASFFKSVSFISGSGTATLQFGPGRMLSEERNLQSAKEFDVNPFEVQSVERLRSQGYYSAAMTWSRERTMALLTILLMFYLLR